MILKGNQRDYFYCTLNLFCLIFPRPTPNEISVANEDDIHVSDDDDDNDDLSNDEQEKQLKEELDEIDAIQQVQNNMNVIPGSVELAPQAAPNSKRLRFLSKIP